MVLSISLFMALWVSPHVKLLFSLQHQHEVTGFINHGWQTRGALGTIIAQLYREKDNMETWLLTIARDLCLSVCPVSRAVYLINFTLGGYIAGEQGCAVSNLVQCGHVACLILINFEKPSKHRSVQQQGQDFRGPLRRDKRWVGEIAESEKSNFTWRALKRKKVDSKNRTYSRRWSAHLRFRTLRCRKLK